MANLDFTPLYRSTIGFDRVPRLFQAALRLSDAELGYPPYNIEKTGEDSYRIVIALAEFGRDDIEVLTEQNLLTVRGKMAEPDGVEYLHRGIAGRSFERRFDLADHIEIGEATLEGGLLTIELKRELPERLQPRKIPIASPSERTPSGRTKAIEQKPKKAA